MKYEFFPVNIFKLWTMPPNWPKMGRFPADFRPKTNVKFFVTKCPMILPKFSRKSVEIRPIFGPKKARGLSGFLDRASGGPGLAKMGRAGRAFKPGPRPDPSLDKCVCISSWIQSHILKRIWTILVIISRSTRDNLAIKNGWVNWKSELVLRKMN